MKLSHPVRGAWIEIDNYDLRKQVDKSHPVRGAWIEIYESLYKEKPKNCRTP